jgi:hypothetical protein
MRKTTLFVGGLITGVALACTWRPLAKGGIKTGIRAGRKLREFSQKAMEDIEDLTAEATEELAEQEAGGAQEAGSVPS